MLLSEESGPFVQIGSNADVEAAFKGLVRRLAFGGAKSKILVHGRSKVGFQAIHIDPFINDGVANAQQRSVQYAVLGATEPS